MFLWALDENVTTESWKRGRKKAQQREIFFFFQEQN